MRRNQSVARIWSSVVVAAFTASAARADITGTDLYVAATPANFTNASWATTETAAGELVGSAQPSTSSSSHAFLWTAAQPGGIDLNPPGLTSSVAVGTNGLQQVGFGIGTATGGQTHAFRWTGNSVSQVDLNPSGFSSSKAVYVAAGQQVGSGSGTATGGKTHALTWDGRAGGAVDLDPGGSVTLSEANATDGTYQVGDVYGYGGNANFPHAVMWAGSADTIVDLNPPTFGGSIAEGVGGGQQVGYGTPGNTSQSHAVVWTGTAASAVDLNASGFTQSIALGANGTFQVGYASGSATGNKNHAILWFGTADSAFDLQSVLPGTFTTSAAYTIDGKTVYGTAVDTSGRVHAVAWTVPEPTSVAAFATAGLALLRRRRSA